MIGADDKAALDRVRPILGLLGKKHFVVGGTGAGHAMKALNNFMAGTGFIAAKYGLPFAPPLKFLLLRFSLVAVLMLAVTLATRAPWPGSRHKGRSVRKRRCRRSW